MNKNLMGKKKSSKFRKRRLELAAFCIFLLLCMDAVLVAFFLRKDRLEHKETINIIEDTLNSEDEENASDALLVPEVSIKKSNARFPTSADISARSP